MGSIFKELLDQFSFNPTEDQWDGKRVFVETPTGTYEEGGAGPVPIPLPVLGDIFPPQPAPYAPAPTNFVARSVSVVYYNNVAGRERKMSIDYSTKDINFSNVPDPDEAQDNLVIGGEFVVLGGTSSNAGALTFLDNGAPIDGKTRKFINTATYTHSESYLTFAASIATITGIPGRVLAAATDDDRWLALGATISEFINDEGESRFQAVRTYLFKEITGPTFSAAAPAKEDHGWNLVWDPKRGHWDKTAPVIHPKIAFPDVMPVL